MIHRGEILRKAISKRGAVIMQIAKAINKDPKTIYNWCAERDLKFENLKLVGDFLGYDFTEEIPEMGEYMDTTYGKKVDYKDKYLKLLEEHNELLKAKNDELIAKVAKNDSVIKLLTQITEGLNQKKNGVSLTLN